MIKAIACIGKNRELGKNNGLIFNIKADMEMFKKITTGAFVVLGSNTLKSFPKGRPLKNRVHLLLCRKGNEQKDCLCFNTLEQLLNTINILNKQFDIYIIGGGMIYKTLLPYCEELILTEVEAEDKEATVFFPEYKKDFEIKNVSEEFIENNYKFKFITYKRKEN